IDSTAVPTLPGVAALVRGNTTGGGNTNRAHFGAGVSFASSIDETTQALLFDPQTSGGLLATIAPAAADGVRDALRSAGGAARTIGHVAARETNIVLVR